MTPIPSPINRYTGEEAEIEAAAVALANKYPDTFGGSYATPREVARTVLLAVREAMSPRGVPQGTEGSGRE